MLKWLNARRALFGALPISVGNFWLMNVISILPVAAVLAHAYYERRKEGK